MSALETLHNHIDLSHIPFTDRGSRLMLFREGQTLLIRLAERWTRWEKEVGHYRQRLPIISRFVLLGMDGSPLNWTADTYPHLAQLHTEQGQFDWLFVDPETLLIRLPVGRYGFEFDGQAQQGQADRRGGTLHGKRNIAYTTNAHLLQNDVSPVIDNEYRVRVMLEAHEGDSLLLNVTPRLGYNRSIPAPDDALSEARSRWQAWFDVTPSVLEEYQTHYDYAWWIMRSGLLNTRYYFSREALVPSKIHYVGVWHWDQFFHAIAYRHINTQLAEDQLRILFDHQQANGMFPDAIHDEGLITHLAAPVDADVTKPPLAAWAVLKLFEKSGHRDFLEEAYEPLVRCNNWWITANTDEDTGLCEYHHPFSSGLDDSPLWDSGMPVVSPDLNTYMCVHQESLAQIADAIGLPADAARYRQQAAQYTDRMLKVLWNKDLGLFNTTHQGEPIPTLTPFSLLPLWTGRLPPDVVARLLEHLTNPATFWTAWPLPTVAISDPKFDPKQMWRGPTWVNINYLFVEALTRIGQYQLAQRLRRKTLELVMQHADIYEYYDPLNADHPPKAAPIFGWSAAVFIDLAIQDSQDR